MAFEFLAPICVLSVNEVNGGKLVSNENSTAPKVFGFKGEAPISLGVFVVTSLVCISADIRWAAWTNTILFVSAIYLLSIYRASSNFISGVFVVLVFGIPAAFYSFNSVKSQAQREAYWAHRAMIGCKDADRYLYFGKDPQSLDGRPMPSDAALARCDDSDDDIGSGSEFRFLIQREGLLGAKKP